MNQFAPLDWILIALYFAVIFGIAWWVAGRKKETHASSTGYFLAGRNVGWFVVGTALFASNIGSEHLVGLAGTGYDSGLAVGQFEVLASLILLILGWLFVPFYDLYRSADRCKLADATAAGRKARRPDLRHRR